MTAAAWVPIDQWFKANPEFSRVTAPAVRRHLAPPEPEQPKLIPRRVRRQDCPRCKREMRIAFAYVPDGERLREVEAFKRCPGGCPGEYALDATPPAG
jgi:hypothetical protein